MFTFVNGGGVETLEWYLWPSSSNQTPEDAPKTLHLRFVVMVYCRAVAVSSVVREMHRAILDADLEHKIFLSGTTLCNLGPTVALDFRRQLILTGRLVSESESGYLNIHSSLRAPAGIPKDNSGSECVRRLR